MKFFNYFKCLLFALAVTSWPIKAKECPPEPLSCLDILRELDTIQKRFDQCCFDINSCLDTVLAEVNALPAPCDQRIFIDQDFMNTATPQITQSNTTYCLVESVTGSLIIDADDVVIEMNGYCITGTTGSTCLASTNHQNIALLGTGCIKGGMNGILFTTCSNVKIEKINFQGHETAAILDTVIGFNIENCSFTENINTVNDGIAALKLLDSRNGKINCCQVHNNSARAGGANPSICRIENSSNIYCLNSHFDNNDTYFNVIVENSFNCNFKACSFNSNLMFLPNVSSLLFSNSSDCSSIECEFNFNEIDVTYYILRILSCNKILVNKCIVESNDGGAMSSAVRVESSNACCVLNSFVKNNLFVGIDILNSTDTYLFNIVAIKNATGFRLTGGTDNVFLSNYAEGNTTNYSNVIPVIRFDTSVGEFRDPLNSCTNVSPSDWDNIAVESCP